MNLNETLNFALAGKAIFTVENQRTGGRHTFRVTAAKPRTDTQATWFVSHLAGSDNETSYQYLGFIRAGAYQPSTKKVTLDAPSQKAARWFFPRLLAQHALPNEVEVHHANRCGRCGRLLTTPESILRGLGPECAEKAMTA